MAEEIWKTFISGYCDDCDIDIPKLDEMRDLGNVVVFEYTCPKCGALWDDSYDFSGRLKIKEATHEEV